MTYQSLKLSDNAVISELAKTNAPLVVGVPLEASGGIDCGQKYCIKKGDKSDLSFVDDSGTDNMKQEIESNYKRIKSDIIHIIENEMERIKNDPNLQHLIQ